MKYDVIVVGAGPAGLTAARSISKKGFKVAIFEKERHLSVKPCGEAVSKTTLDESLVTLSKEVIVQDIKQAAVYAPNGNKVVIEEGNSSGYVLNKKMFLQCLAEKAVEAGTDIFMNRKVVDVKRKMGLIVVKTRGGEWTSNLILGADGFTSIVSKQFGFEKNRRRELISCLQYVMVNCNLDDTQTTEFYLGEKVAPLGYVWIFPKGEKRANVGLGVRGTPAKPYLDKFINEHANIFSKAQITGIEAAPVTISGLLDKIVDDNVMLIGEAAGQVIPLTGGGIHASIVGGRMAGETAIEALEKENLSKKILTGYVEKYQKNWGKRIKDSQKALSVLEKLDDEDLNKLAELLTAQDVLDLANGANIARVGRKFLKHPLFSLKLATALLTS
jgi:digeranylgeranylglycerophospholipid reductase